MHTILQNKRRRWLGPPPQPIIFERQILPQQTIYRWKGNLTASRIHFKYWKKYFDLAILCAIFAKWLRNGSGTAVQKHLKLMKYEHIIYHFEARGLEILNI